MFLKTGEVKKMMKAALKGGGLTVGHMDGAYFVSPATTRWWRIAIDEEAASNKFLAAIIELTGMLPETGGCYDFVLDGKEAIAQSAMDCPDPREGWMYAKKKIIITPLVMKDVTHDYTLLQDEAGTYFLADRSWLDAIAPSELGPDERMPAAPVCYQDGAWCRIYFKNEFMTYQITDIEMPKKVKKALLPALGGLNFFTDDWLPEPDSEEEGEEGGEPLPY